ncbi:MAG: HEAT repeat domain-containing protein [Elusimicrobia bacterium]|nr:HEAT repeat domain-containing protein [Elusimicrobiota bacterium]
MDSALLLGVFVFLGSGAVLTYLIVTSFSPEEAADAPTAEQKLASASAAASQALVPFKDILLEAWYWLFPKPKPKPAERAPVPPLPGLKALPPAPAAAQAQRPAVAPQVPDASDAELLAKLKPLGVVLDAQASEGFGKKAALQAAVDLLQALDNAVRVRLYEHLASESLRRLILKMTAFPAEDLSRMFESAGGHSLQSAILDRVSLTRGMPTGLLFDLVKRAQDPAVQERLYDFVVARDPGFLVDAALVEAFACARSPGMRFRCALKLLAGASTLPLETLGRVLEGIQDTDLAGQWFSAIISRDPKFFSAEQLEAFLKAPASPGLRAQALRHLTEFHGKGLAKVAPAQLAAMAENAGENLAVRCLALSLLAKAKEGFSVGVMGRLAKGSRDPGLVRAATHGLGELGTPEACRLLLDLLESKDPLQRQGGASGLALTSSEAGLDALCGILRSDPVRGVKERLVRAAGHIERRRKAAGRPQKLAGILLGFLAMDPGPALAGDIVETLGGLGDASALPKLLELCDAPDEGLAGKAMASLGQLGIRDDAVLKKLKSQWQEGSSFEVRRAAENALKALQQK